MLQTALDIAPQGPSIDQVLASLRQMRITHVGREHDLQAKIAERFDADDITYAKEFKLSARNRIDFLITGGIGIEVKMGKPYSVDVQAQIERYCRHEQVTRLVLVVERNVFDYNRSADGKPVHYIALNKLWGISL